MKWFPLIGGVFSILYAGFLFANPLTSVATIAWIIALVIFVTGIASFLEYLNNPQYRSIWQLVQSLLSVVFGFLLLSSSVFSLTKAFMTIIAYWVLLSGLLRLVTGIQLRRSGYPRYSINLSSAVLTILFGLILLGSPLFSASIIGIMVAFFFFMIGIALLSLYFRIR
ncbi:HdeD family acid-resistance protein [Streptococcus dentasini]